MDLNVNVKITLSADAELLTHLATFAGTIQEVLKVSNAQLNKAKPVSAPAITADNIASASVPIVPPPATPVVPTAPAKQYTIDEILAACAPLMDAGKVNDLQAIVKGFNVNSMMEIPTERYGELATRLRALGAKL